MMTITNRDTGCIGIQGAPVDVRELLVPCTGKPNRECCGHRFAPGTTGITRPACIRPSGSAGP